MREFNSLHLPRTHGYWQRPLHLCRARRDPRPPELASAAPPFPCAASSIASWPRSACFISLGRVLRPGDRANPHSTTQSQTSLRALGAASRDCSALSALQFDLQQSPSPCQRLRSVVKSHPRQLSLRPPIILPGPLGPSRSSYRCIHYIDSISATGRLNRPRSI